MKKILFAALLLPLLCLAQEKENKDGMKFEHSSWKEIQAKAKAENKFIIMDCYTTWCGPCKYMDANIFPLKESGDFFNANYINVRVQFDSTKDDNDQVKSWFKDMEEINAKYKIRAYPTYLMFNPNGEIVHRAVGSSPAKDFIAKAENGMNPEKQYYTQLKKYENGERSPEFLKRFTFIAQEAYETQKVNAVSAEYIATITDPFTKENLDFIGKFTSSSKDRGFAIIKENPDKVDAVLGKGRSEAKIKAIVYQETVYPVLVAGLRKANPVTPDFNALDEKVSKEYPSFGGEMVAKARLTYLQNKKDWPAYQSEVGSFMVKYGDKATAPELNTYAWTVFENCKDLTCVAQALEWSKLSLKDAQNQNPAFMDTYSNILHKLGRTKEAIEWQEKALAIMNADSRFTEESKKTYIATLEKMKKGEKTWTEE